MPSFLVVSEPALAQACGPLVNGSVTCTSGGNPYAGGISYTTPNPPPTTNLSVTLQSDVNVVFQNPGTAVLVHNIAGGAAVLTANGATIDNTASPNGVDQIGLSAIAENGAGDAIVTATGKIDVRAIQGGNGILAAVNGSGALASVTYDGPGVSSSGGVSTAIQATNRNGNAVIDAAGDILGFVPAGFQQFSGLFTDAEGNGDASVRYRRGRIDVQGNFANGIFAFAGAGSATIITDPGTTIIVAGTNPGDSGPTQPVKPGIDAESGAGTAAGGQMVTVTAASTIMAFGTVAPDSNKFNNPVAIRALSFLDAPISVTYTGPGMTTVAGGGVGILALSGSGNINVNSSGPITANGIGAFGILADSGMVLNTAIGALPGVGGPIAVMATAPISTQGVEAAGIWANSTTAAVRVDATNVSALGQYSTGIKATGGGPVVVNIPTGGVVTGGWQADVTSVGPTLGLPAAGIVFGSSGSTASLTNNGSIGALSDRAIAAIDLYRHAAFGDPQIINNGTITGFVQFGSGDSGILNNGTFNLRHFADTDGDGVRDTLRVAVSDLGPGANNTFTNNGTLALLGGTGAATLDSSGQFLPFGNTANQMALGGPVQGQLLGVATFTNSGIINLQANPVAGDVLVISGGHTPGTSGGGTFVSNGGSLLIDTVLNAGGAASRSDVLVVDNATVGAGATRLSVRDAGGAGALTVGNGILVVQAATGGATSPGAFALSGAVVAGPYEYALFHGSVDASSPQSWYLRSTVGCSVPVAPCPPPGPTPPPAPVPDFRAETSIYAAVPAMTLLYGRNLLDTLHERVGEEEDQRGRVKSDQPSTGWGRVIGMTGRRDGDALGIFGSGPKYSYDFLGLQAGHDVFRREGADGSRDQAGLYFAIGGAQGNVTHIITGTTGDVDFNGYTFGGYWTHFGPTGWYLDAILQGTWYDVSATAHRNIPTLRTHGEGVGASLEAGYPIKLPSGFFIEPQAQIVYQKVNLGTASDTFATVQFDNVDSLAGRIGARFGRTWAIEPGPVPRTITAWIRPNFWYEFRGNPLTEFSSDSGFIPFRADLGGPWGELNVGVSGQITQALSAFANVSYDSRFEGKSYSYNGRVGLRVNW